MLSVILDILKEGRREEKDERGEEERRKEGTQLQAKEFSGLYTHR